MSFKSNVLAAGRIVGNTVQVRALGHLPAAGQLQALPGPRLQRENGHDGRRRAPAQSETEQDPRGVCADNGEPESALSQDDR